MSADLWSRFDEVAAENALNGSEAAALEGSPECLSQAELEALENFDKQIDARFRELDIIEQMEDMDPVWKDDLDHQMQVFKIKSLRDNMAEYAMEHSDNPVLSNLVMQKVKYTDDTLDNRLNGRANTLIRETDELIADIRTHL